MSRIINIIIDPHLGSFTPQGRGDVRCVRFCRYKVFVEGDDGLIAIESAINDFGLMSSRFPGEFPILPLRQTIDKSALESFVANERLLDGKTDAATARSRVCAELSKCIDSPLITDEVRELVSHQPKENKDIDILSLRNEGEISSRTYNCLHDVGIKKLSQLLRINKTSLLKIRNFGTKSLLEVDSFYARKGYEWGNESLVYVSGIGLTLP